MREIAIVGGGLAALRAAEELRAFGFEGTVTVISDEAILPYNRPPLSKAALVGPLTDGECALLRGELDVSWMTGSSATSLDLQRQVVSLDSGDEVPWDGLIVATGRRARLWPDLPACEGMHVLRTLSDARALRASVERGGPVVVIGGGFVGSEVAATLTAVDVHVTVLESAPSLMGAFGPAVSAHLSGLHAAAGIQVEVGVRISEIRADSRVESVALDDGRTIPAATVVVAIGSVPNTEWLATSGAPLHDGMVVCDQYCRIAGRPDVVAAGDVAAWRHPGLGMQIAIEHWTNAAEMARVAARNLCLQARGEQPQVHSPVPTLWSDQHGAKLKAAGLPRLADRFETRVLESGPTGRVVVDAFRGSELIGGIAINDNRAFIDHRRRLGARFSPAPEPVGVA